MEYDWLLLVAVLFILWFWFARRKKRITVAIVNHRCNHKSKEFLRMKDLAEKFIGKECLVYTVASDISSVKGTVKEVTDTGLLIDSNGSLQAVNLVYVVRIQEWPRNSKGKKKTVFA